MLGSVNLTKNPWLGSSLTIGELVTVVTSKGTMQLPSRLVSVYPELDIRSHHSHFLTWQMGVETETHKW